MANRQTLKCVGTSVIAGACAALLSVTLVACGSNQPEDTANTQQQVAQTEPAATVDEKEQSSAPQTTNATSIGESGSEATKVEVINGLKSDVTSFKMRSSADTSWGAELLKSGETIKSNGMVELGFVNKDDVDSYDIVVVDVNGTKVEVAGLDLASIAELKIQVDANGSGYATFKGTDGSTGTTEQKQDGGSDDGAVAAATNEQNQSDEAYSNDYAEPVSSPEPVETYVEVAPEPVVEVAPEPETPAQTADDCTRDNVVLDI